MQTCFPSQGALIVDPCRPHFTIHCQRHAVHAPSGHLLHLRTTLMMSHCTAHQRVCLCATFRYQKNKRVYQQGFGLKEEQARRLSTFLLSGIGDGAGLRASVTSSPLPSCPQSPSPSTKMSPDTCKQVQPCCIHARGCTAVQCLCQLLIAGTAQQ